MTVMLHVYIGVLLAGLTLRGIELAAGQWALRVAMRRALRLHKAHAEAADAFIPIDVGAARKTMEEEAELARRIVKARAN